VIGLPCAGTIGFRFSDVIQTHAAEYSNKEEKQRHHILKFFIFSKVQGFR
jgi:hypothetical protein